MARRWLEFVEMAAFTRKLQAIASQDTLQAIQSDLIADPERWPIVKGTNGARKGRVADPQSSRGKRGSLRYYYVYLNRHGRIYLLALYSKKEASDLSPEQKKAVAKVIALIQEEGS